MKTFKQSRHAIEEALIERDDAGGDGIGIENKAHLDAMQEHYEKALAVVEAARKVCFEITQDNAYELHEELKRHLAAFDAARQEGAPRA